MLSETGARAPSEVIAYYSQGREQNRLTQSQGQLEFARTQELIQRYIAPAPARVLDVGGGAGIYAFWLAQAGYEVHLIDATPLHVEQAKATQANSPHPLASIEPGDARKLSQPDNTADAVLLLGPLYHLTDATDRQAALREAYRVLKPGGIVFAAAISRYASLLDGLRLNFASDLHFASLIDSDLLDGQHRNPTGEDGYFTTAYFHYPADLENEVKAGAFTNVKLLAIEGIGWLTTHFESFWEDDVKRQHLMEWVRKLETEPALLGASSHLMAIGYKPDLP
ncbi:MAG TPA: class I SAM-dependent methyltransferase [Aggregatilineales bacterium]|nr:class I SAM-dependent methyltransferase [Aggregatilineales bacterium]